MCKDKKNKRYSRLLGKYFNVVMSLLVIIAFLLYVLSQSKIISPHEEFVKSVAMIIIGAVIANLIQAIYLGEFLENQTTSKNNLKTL